MVEVKDLYYCLALLNSNIAHIVFNLLNPTINLQNKDVKRFPITINSMKKENIENISKETVELKKKTGIRLKSLGISKSIRWCKNEVFIII